jgi:hypothetical protein
MGLILFGGGGAQCSFPEQGTWTLIILPKLLASEGGGGHPKKYVPDIPKKIFRTYQIRFYQHTKILPDISVHFPQHHVISHRYKKIFHDIKIFPKFLCFARISHWFLPDRKNFGGHVPPPPPPPLCPRPIRLCLRVLQKSITLVVRFIPQSMPIQAGENLGFDIALANTWSWEVYTLSIP